MFGLQLNKRYMLQGDSIAAHSTYSAHLPSDAGTAHRGTSSRHLNIQSLTKLYTYEHTHVPTDR